MIRQLSDIKYYVTPQMFGAIGDGVQDDTTALQNAINYCIENNFKLISSGNYIYYISTSLDVGNCNIDFNGGTITTANNINLFTINTTEYYGLIQNVMFDCANANSGVMVIEGRKKTFKNLIFKNISMYGFYYNNGYEILLSDSHFRGNGTNTSMGIYCNSSDSKFENIILIDCFKGIINKGSNIFDYIHAWISTVSLVNNSIMFDLMNNTAYLNNCISDTYFITFNCNGGSAISNLSKVLFNQEKYSESLSRPYVFYFTSDSNNSIRNSLVNSSISGVRATQQIIFSNLSNVKTKTNNNNLVWVSGYPSGITFEQTTSSGAIVEIKTNKTTVKNGFVNISLVFSINTAISSTFTFSTLDVSYRPVIPYNGICGVGTTEWTINNVGYVYILDKVTGSVHNDGSIKWVKINITYPITNENY